MRRQRNLFHTKEEKKKKNLKKATNERERNNLPDKELKASVVRMLT